MIRIIVPHFPARRSEEFAFPLICQRDSHLLIPYLALMKKLQNVGKKLSWLNFTLFTWFRNVLGRLFIFSLPELLVSKVIFLVKILNSRIPVLSETGMLVFRAFLLYRLRFGLQGISKLTLDIAVECC